MAKLSLLWYSSYSLFHVVDAEELLLIQAGLQAIRYVQKQSTVMPA